MADLTSYLLETDRPRGANLLIRTYNRNAAGNGLRRYLDVQVDHRDPNGRQADPHLTSIPARDGQGRLRQNHATAYGVKDFDMIVQHAGDNRQPILNEQGEQIGMVYGVKAELVPSPYGDGGHFISMGTVGPSDFKVDSTTMTGQALSARRVRQEQAEAASVIFDDEPSVNGRHEVSAAELYGRSTDQTIGGAPAPTDRSRAVPRADDGIYRGVQTPAGVSSQAGLGAAHGPRTAVPSSPSPGAPGSRFNPVVKERHLESSAADGNPRMIRSGDMPKSNYPKLRAPTAQEISALGRLSQAAAEGAREGARIGRSIPKVGPVVGGVVGGVVGAGQGVVREADAKQGVAHAAPDSTTAQPTDLITAEGEQRSNLFAAAAAHFGAPSVSTGTSRTPQTTVKDSYAYRFEEAVKGGDALQFG